MIEWNVSIIKKGANGRPYSAKVRFEFTDDELNEETCKFLTKKVREYVNESEYSFGYEPTCIGTNKPTKLFKTVITLKISPEVEEEDCHDIIKEFKKFNVPKFKEFYEKQKKVF